MTGRADESFSQALATFKTLLWANYALAFLVIPITLSKDLMGFWLPIMIYVMLSLAATGWVTLRLSQGKNWARICFIVSVVLLVPGTFLDWAEQSFLELAFNLGTLLLSLWLLRMMYTEPIKGIFKTTVGLSPRKP